MANRYLPEDPFSFGPSEQEIQDYPYKEQRKKAPALVQWQQYVEPWQKRAEARGFADPFAMIGRDIAAAERDQQMRATEARLQAEIEREIGVPASAPRSGATPARDNPSARPDDAMTRQATRPEAPAPTGPRIGFSKLPPQKTLLEPAPRASTRLPEHGAHGGRRNLVRSDTQGESDRETISPAGAPDRLFGGKGPDAIADRSGDRSVDGDFGPRDYGEKTPREANDLRSRIFAGEYESFAQAAADIEARLGEMPEVARFFKDGARAQFDAHGRRERLLPGTDGGPEDEMSNVIRRMARGQEIDERAERDRQLFAGVNRGGALKVERAAQSGWSLWDAGGGAKLALTNNVGRRFAFDPTNGAQTLNLLQALTDPRTDPRAWREEALAFLPRRQPTGDETWHGMADIDWARLPPDPDAVRQLDAQLALLGKGGDRMQAAYALLPLIGHRVLGPSVLEIGVEFVVGLTPWGDVEEVSEASKDFLAAARANDVVDMALASGRMLAIAATYIPGAKLVAAGKRTARTLQDLGNFAIDPTKAREIVELSRDPREMAKLADRMYRENFLDGGTTKISTPTVLDRLDDQGFYAKLTPAEQKAFRDALSQKVLSHAAEVEIVNFFMKQLEGTDWMVEWQYHSNFLKRMKKQGKSPGNLEGFRPDILFRLRDMPIEELDRLGMNVVRMVEESSAVARDGKFATGSSTKSQKKGRADLKEKGLEHGFGIYHVPHHKLSPEAIRQGLDVHWTRLAATLPPGVTRADVEKLIGAIQRAAPRNMSGQHVIALALMVLGGATAARTEEDGRSGI